MIVIGIDIGVTGAMSAVDSRGTCVVQDLPIVVTDKGKRLDAPQFIRDLRSLVPPGEAALIVAENVHVMQVAGRRMSHSTETTLVGLRFAVHAVADIARIPVELVTPQAWKKHFGIKADKTGKQARDTAAKLYPNAAHNLTRVKDHNRAESLLIAHYGQGALT